jgi:O-acetyl-ADP-ribose deacetylase (regulator of RNase III)
MRTDLSGELEAREEELQRLRDALKKDQKQRVSSVLRETKTYPYRLKGERGKRIALITGDIRKVEVADIWVNSENTNMQMSRFYERSISAIIRYLGAKKDNVGNVTEDVIANELAEAMGNNLVVQPATVLVTGAGELQRTHNVKKIFHVASVHGEIGVGYKPIHNIEYCVTNSLQKADSEELKALGLKSILFPLMGAGAAKGNLKEIAENLLHAAISYMETTEDGTIEHVYFLTWTDVELDTCKAVLEESDKVKALKS